MPLLVILLSILGLVPFVVCGLAALGPNPATSARMLTALIGYAAVILAFAGGILLAALSAGFTSMAQSSTVLSGAEQQQVAKVLEHDAEVVSNTQLQKQLAGQPQKTQDEIIRINTQARHLALQVALLVPILAGLAGLLISFRMMRLPDPRQSGSGEQELLG